MNALQEYEQLLKEFNWAYQYDTDEEYEIGKIQHDNIKKIIGRIDEGKTTKAYRIYKDNAPPEFIMDYANFLVECNRQRNIVSAKKNIKLGPKDK